MLTVQSEPFRDEVDRKVTPGGSTVLSQKWRTLDTVEVARQREEKRYIGYRSSDHRQPRFLNDWTYAIGSKRLPYNIVDPKDPARPQASRINGTSQSLEILTLVAWVPSVSCKESQEGETNPDQPGGRQSSK